MFDPEMLHVVLSFLVGGLFIALCTTAADVFGPELGGVVAGLPSTVVVTLLFVAIDESPHHAIHETRFIPIVLGLNCLFFAVFGVASGWGAGPAFAGGFATWLSLAFATTAYSGWIFETSVLALAFGLGLGYLLLRFSRPAAIRPPTTSPTWRQIGGRATFGGGVIATGVWLGHVAGPIVGGLAAAFPATGVSTLAIVAWTHGVPFAVSLLAPMMLSGSVTILVYVCVLRVAYPFAGVYGGTVAALAASLATATLLYRWRTFPLQREGGG